MTMMHQRAARVSWAVKRRVLARIRAKERIIRGTRDIAKVRRRRAKRIKKIEKGIQEIQKEMAKGILRRVMTQRNKNDMNDNTANKLYNRSSSKLI